MPISGRVSNSAFRASGRISAAKSVKKKDRAILSYSIEIVQAPKYGLRLKDESVREVIKPPTKEDICLIVSHHTLI